MNNPFDEDDDNLPPEVKAVLKAMRGKLGKRLKEQADNNGMGVAMVKVVDGEVVGTEDDDGLAFGPEQALSEEGKALYAEYLADTKPMAEELCDISKRLDELKAEGDLLYARLERRKHNFQRALHKLHPDTLTAPGIRMNDNNTYQLKVAKSRGERVMAESAQEPGPTKH